MKIFKIILISLVALLLLASLWIAWQVFMPLESEQIVVKIAAGDNASAISKTLYDKGIIRNQKLFLLMLKLRKSDHLLKAGTYSFGGHYNLLGALSLLEDGNSQSIRITIPPGFSLYRSLKRMEASGLASYDSLLARAQNKQFIQKLTGLPLNSLEGFLLPETYFFEPNSSVDSLLSIPVRAFFKAMEQNELRPQDIDGFYDKLILASIVEKESAHPDEREIIAGVYLNRLNKHMKLESCPTVDYLLEPQGIKRKVLTIQDLSIQSPYNTYIHLGLPPTPICNPSLDAFKAVVHPKPNAFLFFVANREGRNDFSNTYQEHLRKKKFYDSIDR